MKKKEILNALEEADKPLPIQDLSDETGIPISSLRVDLYRLNEEGDVENIEEKGDLLWKINVSNPIEEKYEKMTEGSTRD